MAKGNRTGNREPRRLGGRTPDLGYYVIVTDTKCTERFYFQGLRDSISKKYRDRIALKVFKADTENLIEKCQKEVAYNPQYRVPWIVLDRDQVVNFDEIIENADHCDISVGWSNPCIEIWMFAYFGEMPNIDASKACVSKFAKLFQEKTGVEYSKSDRDVYRRLCQYGDEEAAVELAKAKLQHCSRAGGKKPSKMCPATTVHQLVQEIKDKITGEP